MDCCCLDIQPAASNANGQVAVPVNPGSRDQERPEMKMNRAALLEVFFASAASGIGTIGFVWATVVLLGGFETDLNQVDFWFITALSFFQALRIFGGDWNTDQKILYGLPLDVLSQPRARICSVLLCFVNCAASFYTPKLRCLLFSGKFVCILSAFLVRLLKILVLLGTLVISVIRLVIGNVSPSAKAANLKSAFSLFYGLAIVQAVVSYMAFSYSGSPPDLAEEIRRSYNFATSNVEDKPFLLYYAHVKKICKAGRITEAINMTLPALAVGSISSNDQQVRVAAIKILQYFMQARDYKEQTLSTIRDSSDAAQSLFRMIASTSQDNMSTEAKEVATSIMVELSGNLRISGIPCVTQSIYLLLETSGRLSGMRIVEQLSTKKFNLVDISSSDELMSKITEFTEPKISRGVSAMTGDDIQMAKTALTVLSRLAGLSGEQGSMMRQLILRNTFLMSSIREVLQGAESDPRLQEMHMRAMEIVDGFALDIESKHHGSITKVLTLLLNVFRRSQNDEIRLAAGKALARLTIESRVNCDAILSNDIFQAFRDMLFIDRETSHVVIASNILKNLCENCEAQHDQYNSLLEFVRANMVNVLEEMYQIGDDNLIGEHMGAFLGLIMQFIKLVTAADFNAAVNGNGDIIGNGDSCKKFVQKLKSILEKANRQVTDIHKMHPGIRRFTTELVIWMARADPELHCIHHFVDCGMRGALVEAEQTARRASRQENFKLFSPGGVPVLEYEESLHSLASRALELIPEEPNVQ